MLKKARFNDLSLFLLKDDLKLRVFNYLNHTHSTIYSQPYAIPEFTFYSMLVDFDRLRQEVTVNTLYNSDIVRQYRFSTAQLCLNL